MDNQSREIFQEAMKRKPTQKQKILNLLREAGKEGVLNTTLVDLCIGFGARIREMYQEGYKINVEHIEKGVCKYILISEPEGKKKNIKSAMQILNSQIENDFEGVINASQLMELLNRNNFHVVRRSGSHKHIGG